MPTLSAKPVRSIGLVSALGVSVLFVLGEEGEAKTWIDPEIAVATVYGLSPKTLGFAVKQTEEREDELREAWNRHFGG